MFLIAVVSIVEGMSKYVEEDFAGKWLGVNTFNVRRFPDINTDVTEAEWRSWQRRPKITVEDGMAIKVALPADARWAIQDITWGAGRIAVPERRAAGHGAGGHGRLLPDQEPDALARSPVHRAGGRRRSAGRRHRQRDRREVLPQSRSDRTRAAHQQVPVHRDRRAGETGHGVRDVARPAGHRALPLADGRITHSRNNLYGIVIQAPSPQAFQGLQETRARGHARRHRLRPGVPDDFALESAASALSSWETIRRYLVLAGMVLPAIGLVVGAIVIMNIMLVAVAERTFEIGIRKSLGARRRDILAQFLVESMTLSAAGAALGVALGAVPAAGHRALRRSRRTSRSGRWCCRSSSAPASASSPARTRRAARRASIRSLPCGRSDDEPRHATVLGL